MDSARTPEDEAFWGQVEAWLHVLDRVTHYELLGLADSCSPSELQAAFHRFSERFHPDRHVRHGEAARSQVRTIFKRGAEAYRVLKNPRLRASYDLELATRTAPRSGHPLEQSKPRALDELCHTAGGRLHARQADRAIGEGRLDEALALLERALRVETENPDLRERLDSLRVLRDLAGAG